MGSRQSTAPNPQPPTQEPQRQTFNSQEAAKQVIGTNQAAYLRHMIASRTAAASARQKATRIEMNLREIARLQEENARLEAGRRDDEHVARVEADFGHGYGVVLTGLSVELPPLPPPDQLVYSDQGDAQTHAAVWNGDGAPQTGVMSAVPPAPTDNPPAGFCTNCGKHVWRDVTPEGEKVLRHGIIAACDPDDPNTKYASLGDEPEGQR